MGKLNLFYIGKDWDGNPKDNLPTGDITAIKMKYDDDGEYHYVPIIPSWYKTVDQVKEVWVCGQGWIKVGKRKKYTIPVYDGTIEHFNEYRQQWGDDVMAYCLNGDLFHRSNDCCSIRYQEEWSCLKYYGPEIVTTYADLWNRLREVQTKFFNENWLSIFKKHGYGDKITKNWLFKPEYCIHAFIFNIPIMSANVTGDDKMMEELWKKLRYWDLYEQHPQHPEFLKRYNAAQEYRGDRKPSELRWDGKWEDFCDKWQEIDNIIHIDAEKQIKEEMELDEFELFPCCMSDRVKILFGEETNKLYNQILKFSKKLDREEKKKAKWNKENNKN